jgi:hypothetical protein
MVRKKKAQNTHSEGEFGPRNLLSTWTKARSVTRCRGCGMTPTARFPQTARLLELVGFLGVAEAGEGVGRTLAVDLDLHWAFAFGTGFAKYGESS